MSAVLINLRSRTTKINFTSLSTSIVKISAPSWTIIVVALKSASMKLVLLAFISMALAANINKPFYMTEIDATCFMKADGGTHCEKGHLYNAATVCTP